MVSKSLQRKFWANHSIFAGSDDHKFLNVEPFRAYLNDHFRSGVTAVQRDVGWTHWVFVIYKRRAQKRVRLVLDSCDDGYQPYTDVHCTMFSFHNEVKRSRLYGRCVGNLVKVEGLYINYLRNLVVVYNTLVFVFTHPDILDYIYQYEEWKPFGKYIQKDRYVQKANENIKILHKVIAEVADTETKLKKLFS